MSLNRRPLFPGAKQLDTIEKVEVEHTIVTSTSGAISSQTSAKYSDMTAALHGSTAGLYTLTLGRSYTELLGFSLTIKGANTTYGNTAGREYFLLPSTDVTSQSAPNIAVQFIRNSDSAVAQVENGATIIIRAVFGLKARS